MKELSKKEIEVILKIDEKIKALYEKRISVFKKIQKRKGLSSGFIFVEGEEKPYHRVKMVDNFSEEILNGDKPAFTAAKINRYSFVIDRLKNEPKK